MKKIPLLIFVSILATALNVTAQKSNDAIAKQIKSLKADKSITLSYDAASDMSKIMVSAGNFDGKEADRAGIQAMNFGMAVFYQGQAIASPPEKLKLTFWVMTKRPQFADSNTFIVTLADGPLDLGAPRYISKPGNNMEYLNFELSREALAKIAAGQTVRFKLGKAEFTFTNEQIALFRNLLSITDSR